MLDPYFAGVRFTFKAGCPSALDCAAAGDAACDLPSGGPAIDYLAKDFASFRARAAGLLGGAYPRWVERDEADLGMMLAELLSAVGDDLSYHAGPHRGRGHAQRRRPSAARCPPRPAGRLRTRPGNLGAGRCCSST